MALDCLPVLAKLMSEASTYDELISEERASDERVHATDLRFREETATVDKEVEIYLAEMRKRGLDQEERVRNAQGDTDGLDDVRAPAYLMRAAAACLSMSGLCQSRASPLTAASSAGPGYNRGASKICLICRGPRRSP